MIIGGYDDNPPRLRPGAEQLGGQANARQIAQTLIDTLGMLETKTRGQLDADEQQLMTQLLTSLRIRYVQSGSH